jgi:hypothetical protein
MATDEAEARRLIGVVLGYPSPANAIEVAGLAALRAKADPAQVAAALVQPLAAALAPRITPLSDSDVDRIAEAVADRLSIRLAT